MIVGQRPLVNVRSNRFVAIRTPSNHEPRLLQFCPGQSYGKMSVMAGKKKVKRFRAVQAVKELARERLGTPPAEKVVPHKNKKAEKHKPTLGKLLEEPEQPSGIFS
jgi:hypothetical protein